MKYSIQLFCAFLFLSSLGFSQEMDMSLFHGMKPRNIGPAGMSGRVTAIDVVLNDSKHIYIGAAAGGVWESRNGGFTFEPIFDKEKTASIGAIAIYQKTPAIIYVGTGEGNPRNSQNSGMGMYKTINGGRTWMPIGLENTRQIHRVIVHPENPDIVWAGVSGATWGDSEERGVYKTTDGGKSWRKVLYVNPSTGIADLVVDPQNPNKLIAAMWDHRRTAWNFRSGGPGSAIYISYDGGESWDKVSKGLPSGELGRIGLSFAPSNPALVYAFVESKSNGIFRSEDGGETWKRQSPPKAKNIGSRPFYYADIYVDSKNENRVYTIATVVNVSEDGGKSWKVFAKGNKIHTDHHAFWSHPDDPDYIMIGSDGGLHITLDRGTKWNFCDHLPLAQFYHMRVDNEIPYNVYGGLQDNGSWAGPSQTWFKGGIRNFYWQRLSVGDGFDVVPDPKDHNYGYAMGQAGSLVRYHKPSGQLKPIMPVHPEGEFLRYNWNAGIAIDPFDDKTIYYGSQYVHKTEDHGQSWKIISPDLTTNDPEKQKFLETGGLTYDVTGAEYHTTIITIAPSRVKEGVIWVGTDDGNVQVTQDGGKTWQNTIEKIKEVPANTWVPHIKPSNFDEGEAFVVFDDHRRNNWTPYVYRTKNFGKSWDRIVGPEDVDSYVYCFEQDPVESDLYFCGTDGGLYVSFDAGKSWNRWTEGYPTVPTSDLVIHPRDHDLIIGTFGRSFWILDDIRPLRAIAQEGKKVMKNTLHAFPAPDAIQAVIGESIGYREGKVGDFLYKGKNRPFGALISYYLEKEDMPKGKVPLANQVKVEISDSQGKLIRTLYQVPKLGFNRVNWDLSRDGFRNPSQPKPKEMKGPSKGLSVAPGTYAVKISWLGNTTETEVKVLSDPRLEVLESDMVAKEKLFQRYLLISEKAMNMGDKIRNIESDLKFIESKTKENVEMKAKVDAFKTVLVSIKDDLVGPQKQGIYRDPAAITSILYQTRSLLNHILTPPSENQQNQLKILEKKFAAYEQRFQDFLGKDVIDFRSEVKIGVFD